MMGTLFHPCITCLALPSAVDAPAADPITDVAMTRVCPNPARGVTSIYFELPRQTPVRITVYDVLGRRVARPLDGIRPAGRHVTTWDGNERSGRIEPGLYWIRFEAEGRRVTRGVIRLR